MRFCGGMVAIGCIALLLALFGMGVASAQNGTEDANNTSSDLSDPVPRDMGITGPTVITEPGTYYVLNDILDSDAEVCIDVQASGVIIEGNGHTIDGVDGFYTRGIYGGATVRNVTLSDWYYGAYTANNDLFVTQSTITSNYIGVGCGDEIMRVEGNTISDNVVGISLDNTGGCTVRNNRITNNSNIGISVEPSDMWQGYGNFIYNNYLSNPVNMEVAGIVEDPTYRANSLNTTLTSAANMIAGPYLGGNFWGSPEGQGYSETCTDANSDGICDAPYALQEYNTDFHPLTALSPTTPIPTVTPIVTPTAKIPPGQDKRPAVPPGQEKRPVVPSGQEKKLTPAPSVTPTPTITLLVDPTTFTPGNGTNGSGNITTTMTGNEPGLFAWITSFFRSLMRMFGD